MAQDMKSDKKVKETCKSFRIQKVHHLKKVIRVRYKPLTSGFSAKVFRKTNNSPNELGNVTHKQSLELRRGANIVRHLHPVSCAYMEGYS